MKDRLRPCLLPVLGSLAVSWPLVGKAELPPWVYGQEQRQSPYALELLVRSVQRSAAGVQPLQLRIQAQVLAVQRQPAGSQLKPGERITLSYALPPVRPAGWVGPSPLPSLEPGERVPAWLTADPSNPGVYQPAAGGRSFGPSLEAVFEPGG